MVVEAAGSARAFEEGPSLVRDGGRYVVAGHYTDAGPSSINVHRRSIASTWTFEGAGEANPDTSCAALTLLERFGSQIPWSAIGGRTYPLDKLDAALADAEAMRITKALVDPWACLVMEHTCVIRRSSRL